MQSERGALAARRRALHQALAPRWKRPDRLVHATGLAQTGPSELPARYRDTTCESTGMAENLLFVALGKKPH
jgi:hypothetical protein